MSSLPIILRNVQYRLSRVWSGGVELQIFNRVILFTEEFATGGAYFVEGFNAAEFIAEGHRSTWQFRKQSLTPQMIYDFDKLRIIGSEQYLPTLRSRLSITPGPFGLKVNREHDVFSCKLRDVVATWGQEIEAFNSNELGTNTNIEFYDRDVRSVSRQRNVLGERARLTPTLPPEAVAEPLLETLE